MISKDFLSNKINIIKNIQENFESFQYNEYFLFHSKEKAKIRAESKEKSVYALLILFFMSYSFMYVSVPHVENEALLFFLALFFPTPLFYGMITMVFENEPFEDKVDESSKSKFENLFENFNANEFSMMILVTLMLTVLYSLIFWLVLIKSEIPKNDYFFEGLGLMSLVFVPLIIYTRIKTKNKYKNNLTIAEMLDFNRKNQEKDKKIKYKNKVNEEKIHKEENEIIYSVENIKDYMYLETLLKSIKISEIYKEELLNKVEKNLCDNLGINNIDELKELHFENEINQNIKNY